MGLDVFQVFEHELSNGQLALLFFFRHCLITQPGDWH